MTEDQFCEQFASIVVAVGLNVQRDQEVYVRAPIEASLIVPHLTRAAYARGAKYVHVEYRHQAAIRARMEYAPEDTLTYVPPGLVAERLRVGKEGGAELAILGEDPMGLDGVPPERRGPVIKASAEANSAYRELAMKDFFPWCVISMPNPSWAARVYPDLEPAAALARLRDDVAHACRLDTPDPVASWQAHSSRLTKIAAWLTEQAFDRFEYKADGTDLIVGMPARQHWIGTEGVSENGITFIANIPTDEVFCAPDWRRVDGTVRSSRPMILGGTNVGYASFVVEGGRITSATCDNHQEILDQELDLDDRSRYFGEIALVTEDAPIAALKTTFYDGLYDENAGCHFAFGAAYSNCVEGGAEMDDDQRVEAGLNVSKQHVDFTVGSDKLSIVGVRSDGSRTAIMERGLWTSELLTGADA
jgi:aminopeptidase